MSEYSAKSLHDGLVAHGLILPTTVQGVFGRSAVFEDVLQRVADLITRMAKDDGAEVMLFPPVLERKTLERSGYLESFPHLAGSVFSFTGDDAQHKELCSRVHHGEPWADLQSMTDVVLIPAACYPLYPHLAGRLPKGGRTVDMQHWVFRHEPSPEPTRMQSFRVREFVRAGSPDEVVAWRDLWLERGLGMLRKLGLPAEADTASDPFFGRGGRMLAAGQREAKLKFEVLVPVISRENPTALCSFNYHQDHFGQPFGIQTEDGKVAHTACLGFGMERVVMALFRTHGYVPVEWPRAVREVLWP